MLRLNSATAGLSSGPGFWDRTDRLSCVSAEKPPHMPVMLKEVLHYLDVQPAQVRSHLNYLLVCFCVFYTWIILLATLY